MFTRVPANLNIISDGGDITIVLPHGSTTNYAINYQHRRWRLQRLGAGHLAATANKIDVDSGGGNVSIAEAS